MSSNDIYIYIPKDFVNMYTTHNDTLYMFQNYIGDYIEQKCFVYYNVFIDTFYLMKPLKDIKPDSIFKYSIQEIYYNELMFHTFEKLCKGKKILRAIKKDYLPRNLKYVKIRCYKNQIDTTKHGYNALHNFEKTNSIDLISEIYY